MQQLCPLLLLLSRVPRRVRVRFIRWLDLGEQ